MLGFYLLLGFDIIKKLGGVCVTSNGTVSFPQLHQPSCAAITINEPDFHVEYDQSKKIWVASWKWAKGHPPVQLNNNIPEDRVPADVRQEYDAELSEWLNDG